MDFNLGSGCVSFFINDPEVVPPSGRYVVSSSSDILQELVSKCVCMSVCLYLCTEGFLWASVHLAREEATHCSVRRRQDGNTHTFPQIHTCAHKG